MVDDLITRLHSAEGSRDPYPIYDSLRRLGPAVRVGHRQIMVSRYDACASVLRNKSFGVQDAAWRDKVMIRWREHPAYVDLAKFMVLRDPPDHTRLRAGIGAFFSAERLRSLRPLIERVTTELLADLAETLRRDGVADFMDRVAWALPLIIISELIGIPQRDRKWLSFLVAQFSLCLELSPSPEQLQLADDATARIREYVMDLVSKKRNDGSGDAITAWIAAADDGSDLSLDDVLATIPAIFAAGISPPMFALGNGLAALASHPEKAAELREHPELGLNAADELMRFDTPVQIMSRVALRPVTIGDVDIRPGEIAHLLIASANRDPSQFDQADVVDIRRAGIRALSYGHGVHRCLGAPLASLEMAILLPALLAQFPTLHLAGEPSRRPGVAFRGFLSMPVAI